MKKSFGLFLAVVLVILILEMRTLTRPVVVVQRPLRHSSQEAEAIESREEKEKEQLSPQSKTSSEPPFACAVDMSPVC
jgi:hypothetical protein